MARENTTAFLPEVSSYDSGYEHSIEHWAETQALMEEGEESERRRPITLPAASKAVPA